MTTYDWNKNLGSAFNTLSGTPTIVGASPGDMLLCRIGGLPTGFASTGTSSTQLPYAFFAVNLNSSLSTPVGGIATQTTVEYIGIAIIIVIIIGIAALAMIMLRKRP